MEAAKLGRNVNMEIRSDWGEVKVEIMKKAVKAKFEKYEELNELLLSTGDAEIIEHTKNDSFWADGGDGSGKNMLGKILMRIREENKNKF